MFEEIRLSDKKIQQKLRAFYIPGQVLTVDLHLDKIKYNRNYRPFFQVKFLTKNSLFLLTEELNRVN
jgi:hypothetical protein